MHTLNKTVSFGLIFLGLILLIQLFGLNLAYGGLFGNSVPKGKEIRDSYLEELFAPEFPYESIKIIDTEDGKRYVVIKAKNKITQQIEKEYQEKTLWERNIAIYRYRSPRTNKLITANIRLSRKVSDEPYIIEYCQANPWSLREKERDIAWSTGKYLIIWIDKEFGQKFKKLIIYPDREAKCPELPFIEKYSNSIMLGCIQQTFLKDSQPFYKKGQRRIVFKYVSKDDPRKIYEYYKDKLLEHFKYVGVDYPEKYWKISTDFGIQISHYGIDIVDTILGSLEDKYILHGILESNLLKGKLSTGGVIFNIKIIKGIFAEKLVSEYSWIEIYYDIEPDVIDGKKKRAQYGGRHEKF